MVRMVKLLAVVAAVTCLWPSPVMGQACPNSQPYGHFGLAPLSDCAEGGRLNAFAYAPGTPATSGSTDILCEADGTTTQGAEFCSGGGAPDDGLVSIVGNWANNNGVTGCPNPNGVVGIGRNVYVVRDSRGGGVVMSVGYSGDFGGYVAEFAHPGADLVLSCRAADGGPNTKSLNVRSVSKSDDGVNTTVTIDAEVLPPHVFSDCDPDSAGAGFGTCTEGSLPVAPGRLLSRVGACDGSALDDLRTSAWTAFSGTATFPSDACLFLGATGVIGTTESPSVLSALAIGGNLAPAAKALDVRARQAAGDVVITFRTSTEVGLFAFEIVTKNGRKIADVSPQGLGGAGAAYSVSTRRGDWRAERDFYVVAVTDQGRINSDPARF